jgi:cobalt-zinc-cadmium efflux system outer membrane protein
MDLKRQPSARALGGGGTAAAGALACQNRLGSLVRRWLWLPAAGGVLAGCASYRPQPLTRTAVEPALHLPSRRRLVLEASQIAHPLLRPVRLEFNRGLGPDQVAVLAVLVNPALRANRDRRALAAAQTLSAGILPNPTVGYARDFVTGGNTLGTVTAYNFTASWDLSSVVSRNAKVRAAKKNAQSIELDVAWTEWQTAEAAKLAFFRVLSLRGQVGQARRIDSDLRHTAELLQKAVEQHQKSVLDLAAAQAASADAHTTYLALQQELERQTFELKRAIGVPPDASLPLRTEPNVPAPVMVPDPRELTAALEHRRLDLLGLRAGYESQDEKLHAAVLAQLPRINLGFAKASDTTNVHTTGGIISIDLPIFDRNQGNIATEKATRQSLYDEYMNRLFQARVDVAQATADLRSLNEQLAAAAKALSDLGRLLEVAQTALNSNQIDAVAYFQAKTNYDQKQIQLLKLMQQAQEFRIALELAAGRYLPGR